MILIDDPKYSVLESKSKLKVKLKINTAAFGLIALFLTMTIILTMVQPFPVIHAQATSGDAYEKVMVAFTSVQEADIAGGDVDHLVSELNGALELIAEGDLIASTNLSEAQELYQQAEDIADWVILEAPIIKEEGILAQQNSNIILGIELIILVAFGLIIYKFGPKLLWDFWLRTHREWKVK